MEKAYKDVQIGQKVYLLGTGNLARNKNNIKEGNIIKIGRKYFYVDIIGRPYTEKFEINTLENINEDYNSKWVLYFSMTDLENEDERKKILFELRKFFDWAGNTKNLSLGQLQEIKEICKI